MKKKFYVFKSEYTSNWNQSGVPGMNVLKLVAVFESDMEAEAKRFVSGTGGNSILYLWDGGGVDVEEAK